MAYPTAAELVAASSVEALTALNGSQQEALRVAAIAAVEAFTNQRFDVATETRVVDASGIEMLYLPQRLETITALTISGTSIPLSSVALSASYDRLHFVAISESNYYERALAELDPLPGAFDAGTGRVTITGTWGWSSCPDDVKTALRYDMEDQALADSYPYSDTVHALRRLGVRQAQEGAVTLQLEAAPGLTERVTRLLDRYVWMGEAGRMV